ARLLGAGLLAARLLGAGLLATFLLGAGLLAAFLLGARWLGTCSLGTRRLARSLLTARLRARRLSGATGSCRSSGRRPPSRHQVGVDAGFERGAELLRRFDDGWLLLGFGVGHVHAGRDEVDLPLCGVRRQHLHLDTITHA